MCFYINQHNPNPIIATENIECYKVGYKALLSNVEVFKSQYRNYLYTLNSKKPELQLNPRHDSVLDYWFIQEGYHSYSNSTTAILNAYSDQVVVKCIIPKGSTYYYNPIRNEYVSTSLIITNFFNKLKL